MRPTDLAIERGTDRDLPAVMALVGRVIEHLRALGIDQWDDVYPGLARFTADVTEGSLYVASTIRDGMVGVFVVNQVQDPEYAALPWSIDGAPVAVVHRLMVEPRFQGFGVAKSLMQFAERIAQDQGYVAMRLDAFKLNPGALALYRSLGYREAGEVTFRKGPFICFEKRLSAGPEEAS